MKYIFWIAFIIVEIVVVALIGKFLDATIGNNIFSRSIMCGVVMAAFYLALAGGAALR